MDKLIVDRITEGFAVCEREDLTHVDLPLSSLPDGVHEGSVLAFDGDEYILDEQEEELRRKRIKEKQRKLFGHRD